MPEYVPIPDAMHARARRSIHVGLGIAATVYAIAWVLLLTHAPIAVRVSALVLAAVVTIIHSERTRRPLDLLIHQYPVFPRPLNRLSVFARVAAAFAILGLLQTTMQHPGSLTGAATALLTAAPFLIAGTALIRVGSYLREATPPSCPHCHYPVADLPFPLTCPECARHMSTPADAVTIPLIKRPALTRAGIAVIALGVILWGAIVFRPGGILAAMPLPARLVMASTDPKAFATINTATLSTEERDRLIARILDARSDVNVFQLYPQLEWLGDQLIAGKLNEEQAHEMIRDGWDVGITAAPSPRVGQDVTLSLQGRTPVHHPIKLSYLYATRGFTDNPDAPTPRMDNTRESFLASTLGDLIGITDRADPRMERPYLSLNPGHPGSMRVQARLFAFVVPTDTKYTIVWNPDGSCTITPPPLDMHEITLETTLTITP